jgi:predicted lipid-binding transport protein (Tim44 family)
VTELITRAIFLQYVNDYEANGITNTTVQANIQTAQVVNVQATAQNPRSSGQMMGHLVSGFVSGVTGAAFQG